MACTNLLNMYYRHMGRYNSDYHRGLRVPNASKEEMQEYILARISVQSETGCWIWQRYKEKGYGRMKIGGHFFLSHRVAYTGWKGPIPDGKVLDHLCRNPSCCNPDHLEPVTSRENVLRGNTIPASHASKTHCANGHEYTDETTRYRKQDGSRECRICAYLASQRHLVKRTKAPRKYNRKPHRFEKYAER